MSKKPKAKNGDLSLVERRNAAFTAKQAARAAEQAAAPRITEQTKITIIPTPAWRWLPSGPIVSGFAAAGIGRHAEPCSGWAAAMTGGAQ